MSKILKHPMPPIFDENSKILILGSFPSPKSRNNLMYYSNPQNRFWSILSTLFSEDFPQSNQDKTNFLLRHNIALWDVICKCEITNADDSTIKNVTVNNLQLILNKANIKAIFTTGKIATKLYQKHFQKESIYLPSPSSANATFSIKQLVNEYQIILEYLK